MKHQLNLAIDGRALVGHRTGIGVHTAEISSRLLVDPAPLIATHAVIEDRTGIEHCRFRVDPSPLGVLWQQTRFHRVVEEEQVDVVWGPHTTLPLRLRGPAVVSIHDLTSITMPHRHQLRTLASFNLFVSWSLDKADAIAAVSQVVADETMRGFGVPSSKIHLVPNGVDDFFFEKEDPRPLLPAGVPEHYILYAGTLEPRKGVDVLLSAWERLADPPTLVLCGDPGWHQTRVRRRMERHGSKIVRTGFVDRRVLRALMRQARLFVYPSRYEGFGLPPLEAMACGTPVVATRAGALPEVLGDAAVLVQRDNPEELALAISRLLEEQSLRSELIEKGRTRAGQFRWDHSAELMTELLLRAAGN